MASSMGKAFKASNDPHLAPGTSHDAGVRRFRNAFDLANDDDAAGGTANSLKVAAVREGNVITGCDLSSSVDESAINFTLGTLGNPTKYAAAQAGPAAGKTVRLAIVPAMLASDPLAAPEDIYLFPSGNLAAAGTLVASVFTSKR